MVDCLYHRIGKMIQYTHSSLLESRPESIVGKSTHKEFQKEIAHKHYFEICLIKSMKYHSKSVFELKM